jgi:hypothetical protein
VRVLALLVLAGCGSPATQADGRCAGRTFDRACTVAADCALLHHQLDCCGSEGVWGISAATLAAAQQAERACMAVGPVCRCAAKQPVADDGKTFPDAAALKLRCTAGRCESFVD